MVRLRDYILSAFNDDNAPVAPQYNKIDSWISSYKSYDEEHRIRQFLSVLQQDTIDIGK